MEKYEHVATTPPVNDAHWSTSVAAGGTLLPTEVSLTDLLRGNSPEIPSSWSREDDDIRWSSPTLELYKGMADDLAGTGVVVLFEFGVFVYVRVNYPEIPVEFAAQLEGDLVHYKTPIHRIATGDLAVAAFLQTAAWWKHHVKENYTEAERKIILQALYMLSSTAYLSAGFSGAFTSTVHTRQNTEDHSEFVAVVHAPLFKGEMGVIVCTKRNGENCSCPREVACAKMGLDAARYCKMQPRVVSIHQKK